MQVPMPTWEGSPPPQVIADYIVGLDLPQAQATAALAVVERTFRPWTGTTCYACRDLRRWPLGTPHTQVAAELGAMLARSAASANVVPLANATVVVDATGVGLAVVDLVARLPGMWDRVVRVVVTAGQAASYDRGTVGWHVPRKELIGVLQTLMQTGRLAIASSLPEARTLVEEMQLFKARAKAASGDALEDWRERDHDDLVLSLALPLWYAEQNPPQAWNEDFWFACGGMDPFGR